LELSLTYCPRIQNSAFLEIGRGCSLLRSLYLVDCSSISDDALCHIAQGCKNLTALSIRRGYEVHPSFYQFAATPFPIQSMYWFSSA
jgi:F-box and leucine-rich repeat protein 2/20